MFNFSNICLIAWLPVVFFVFERQPLQQAIVGAFVSAWLFLPPTGIGLPGVPDLTKMTATVVSVLICTFMKRPQAYLGLRPRWFDLPVIAFCACPFASAVTANQGAYDGLSAVLEEVFAWGIPYVIGRAFLSDVGGNRALAWGLVLGGIAYIPICLFEIRMSPQLKMLVYGIYDFGGVAYAMRYGGYRPVGFLVTGLELGWWMCCSTFAAYMLWRSGAKSRVMGYPLGPVVVGLALVTVACKSTGAILQILIAFALVHLGKATRTSIFVWSVLLIPPAYCIARPTGIWTGKTIVSYADQIFGADRAQSLEFRFDQEEYLMRSALERPVFGAARNGGFNPPDKLGRIVVTDGYWIIVLGTKGVVGLVSLLAMLLLPTILFITRVRAKDWFHPDVAAVTTLSIILPLFMLDNLSNAMLNPIYAIAMGSTSGFLANYSARRLDRRGSPAEGGDHHPAGPTLEGASRAPGLSQERGMAVAAFEGQRYPEAVRHLDVELDDLHQSFRRRPSADLLIRLGRAHSLRARCYARMLDAERSIEEREYLLGLWGQFAPLLGGDPVDHPDFAGNLNDLAWSLVLARPHDRGSVDRAIAHASRIVNAHPAVGAYWNTLGVARYRAGDYLAAIQALSRSINLSPCRGSRYDFYYLALANHHLGYSKPAQAWLDRAEGTPTDGDEGDRGIETLRAEVHNELFG